MALNVEMLDFSRLGVFSTNDIHTIFCLTEQLEMIHDGSLVKGEHKGISHKRIYQERIRKLKKYAKIVGRIIIYKKQ